MPRHASSRAPGPSRRPFQIVFLPGPPACRHECHLASRAIPLRQHVLRVPTLHFLWGNAMRQHCRAVRLFWSCLFQPPVIIRPHLPGSERAAWMEQSPMCWCGYCRVCMIGDFICEAHFSEEKSCLRFLSCRPRVLVFKETFASHTNWKTLKLPFLLLPHWLRLFLGAVWESVRHSSHQLASFWAMTWRTEVRGGKGTKDWIPEHLVLPLPLTTV